MAYRIVKNAAVWWPVRWMDVEEDGSLIEREVEFKFKRQPKDAIDDAKLDELLLPDFVTAVAVDWRGVEAEDGKPLAFSRMGVETFLNQPGEVFPAVARAWNACMNAEPERRLGNFAPPPADGLAAATVAPPATGTATA